ncbi:hypothetical protein GOC57_03270 [Sinorhizobium meliloti]|nr:hypothetical protein CDO28_19255 [Sinorhizobium meliloti]ASQ13294.1 hypothetical protein CDO22_25645 [Sinorhizobium meliloti]MDW9374103.1 hypothetical protein [Sinorhizobium meliloti]MDW9463895.1 hypothetical protein [Sinorhizobium meliloti]MDW9492569.1 hypothetical protein [Sinorhizobium meliloti]
MLTFDRIGADFAMTPIWIGLLSVLLGTPFSRKALADGRMIGRAGFGRIRSQPYCYPIWSSTPSAIAPSAHDPGSTTGAYSAHARRRAAHASHRNR